MAEYDVGEKTRKIAPFVTLPQEGCVIIGSGSSRNDRILRVSPHTLDHLQLTGKTVGDYTALASLNSEWSKIMDKIWGYREPRGQWRQNESGTITDNNLSINKARLALAAALILSTSLNVNDFAVIGRDFTVASRDGEFMDRPGFLYQYQRPLTPESWVQEGTDNNPVEPVDQYARLYEPIGAGNNLVHFYSANSTSLLSVSLNNIRLTIEDLHQLIDFAYPLPAWIQGQSQYSFMALQPTYKSRGKGADMISELSSMRIGMGGEKLYSIPGIVDWSQFTDELSIWIANSSAVPIYNDFFALQEAIHTGNGEWKPFNDVQKTNKDIEDELVGISTHSLRLLFGQAKLKSTSS